MLQISFYVPKEDAEKVKMAMFSKGAGRYKNYDCCSFETLGTGQFRALDGANPHVGEIGSIHYEPELKIEMIVEKKFIKEVVKAMKASHPYEEVAYLVTEIMEY